MYKYFEWVIYFYFQVYLSVVIFFVVLSIFNLSMATVSSFKTSPTKAELREYVSHEGSAADWEVVDHFLEALSDDVDIFDYILYDIPDDYDFSNSSYYYDYEPIENNNTQIKRVFKNLNLLSLKKKKTFLAVCDYMVLAFFTLELIARLITCPSLLLYYKSILNIMDTVVLLLAYAEVALRELKYDHKFQSKGLQILLYFQMLRIFRILRIMKNITAIQVLAYSFTKSYKDFLVLVLYISIAMTLFGSLFYFVEDKNNIKDIPEAFWLCIITMTTVGYGDLYPRSIDGRIIGGFCAMTGVLLLSLIIPVFVGTFVSVYEYASCCKSLRNRKMNIAQVHASGKVEYIDDASLRENSCCNELKELVTTQTNKVPIPENISNERNEFVKSC